MPDGYPHVVSGAVGTSDATITAVTANPYQGFYTFRVIATATAETTLNVRAFHNTRGGAFEIRNLFNGNVPVGENDLGTFTIYCSSTIATSINAFAGQVGAVTLDVIAEPVE